MASSTTANDFNTAYEDNIGGNSTVVGNVLTNDTGITSPKVTAIKVNGVSTVVPATGSVTVTGTYGSLTISADGNYTYALNNAKPAVQALGVGDSASEESFQYTVNNSTTLKSNLKETLINSPHT